MHDEVLIQVLLCTTGIGSWHCPFHQVASGWWSQMTVALFIGFSPAETIMDAAVILPVQVADLTLYPLSSCVVVLP